ncbi:2Fe-2S iron-sulfur cluster-binding protein [Phenylobacterium sp.]|jgi:2Fe-2S ferredoxin|uniref:2Fe-2S iron-sulfur cluster-binding protein n=1 Tax=Phenylobacterium sp. TaxID=1871053 RepID=UPI0035B166E2
MPKIIYHAFDGEIRTVEVSVGATVMDAAVRNAVPGIDGDCGGACACATCHVYVPDEWLARLEPQSEMEQSMLEFAENVRPSSRLGCQIKMEAKLDGLEVQTPESQH